MNQLVGDNCISPFPFLILNSLSFYVLSLRNVYSVFHLNLHFSQKFPFFLLWNFSLFWLFMCLREYYYILSSVSSNECSLGVLRDWIYVKETDLNVLSPYNQATNQSLNKPIPIWTGQGS